MAQRAARGSRIAGVKRAARRAWPVAVEAWRRWDNLSPQQKERYRKMASDYTGRGRKAIAARRARRR
jgi:hypothetical protein